MTNPGIHGIAGEPSAVPNGSVPSDDPSTLLRAASRDARVRWRRLVPVIAAGFVLLASACALAGILAWRDIRATAAVVEARQSRLSATQALEAVLNAETRQRGFLLMREPGYLAGYDAARAAFARHVADLRRELPGQPAYSALTESLARVGLAKFAELDRTIALAEEGHFDEAVAMARTGAGKSLMDDLRRTVDALAGEADLAVARTTATQTRLSALLLGALVTALLCVAGLATALLVAARRRFGVLETRETSARRMAEVLERRVAFRTRELAEANRRFDAALRASGVTVMTQDRDLVFTWISRGVFGHSGQAIAGMGQHEVIPEVGADAAAAIKRAAIETGEPARGDIRVVHDGQETWYDLTVHPLTDEAGSVAGVIAGAVDITRYKEQEARIRLLMRELTHRSKNLLTVIQAIMRQTANNCETIEDFETRFAARLQSLAGSHDLLVREDWQGASIRELVRSQLGHYSDDAASRIEMTGDPLRIKPDAAQHIGMALHELATNAAKYGALSTPDGKVGISWRVAPGADGTPCCYLTWEESGGPPVARPGRRGFGRVVIERTVARALHGEVAIDYAPSGLRWTLEFPLVLNSAG